MCGHRNRAGAAVYITANTTDGHGRKAENIAHARCVFADFDEGIQPLPLEPTAIILTSVIAEAMKAQCWWLINQSDGMDFTTFDGIMARLVADHRADPRAKDRARILRVPGFLHCKNPAHPHLVRMIGGSGRRYSVSEMIAAFPLIHRPEPSKMAAVVLDAKSADRVKRYAIAAVNGEARKLASLQDGRRSAVFLAACSIGKFAVHRIVAASEIEAVLMAAWEASGGAEKHGRAYPQARLSGTLHHLLSNPASPVKPQLAF